MVLESEPHQTGGGGNVLGALRGILVSGRVYVGISTNALSSLGNFALSISLARLLGVRELGEFAITFAVYAFAAGLIRAAVCEPLLGMRPAKEDLILGARRASLVSVVAALSITAVGFILSFPYLVVLGASIHGLALLDYSKTMNLAMFNRRTPLIQEVLWFAASAFAAGLALSGIITGIVCFAIWAAAGSLIGYGSALVQRFSLVPRWNLPPAASRNALAFGGDYVIGSGTSQVSFNLIGVVAGLPAVGALRAGGTLLGPVSIVIGSAQTLAIPYLTRGIALGRSVAWSRTLASTAIIASCALPLLGLLAFMPRKLGELILGSNWAYAQPVLPFLALEMAFIALVSVPFAGFRALQAGRASVLIRSVLAIARLSIVVGAAILGGVTAVAIALAAASGLGAIVWWCGYAYQVQTRWRITK